MGAPDVMISYSWRLDWRYLVHFLLAIFGPDVRCWIDILACNQYKVAAGELDEIQQLPEVVDYAGKVIVLPGTTERLWCIYEFAWSVELNNGSIFYAFNQGKIELDDELLGKVQGLVDTDKLAISNSNDGEFMDNAQCWNPSDQAFILQTIKTRLGGKDQVTAIVKRRFRKALGIKEPHQQPKNDRGALVQWFMQSDGANWTNKEHWLESGVPLGQWHGVSTHNEDKAIVVGLALPNGGLSGKMGAVMFWLGMVLNARFPPA